jgi:hypothetical protein
MSRFGEYYNDPAQTTQQPLCRLFSTRQTLCQFEYLRVGASAGDAEAYNVG